MPFSPNAARGEVGTASSGRRTGEAEVEDDDGASGAAVDDRCERGGGTTSALGVGARGGGDRGRRRGWAAELWAALGDGGPRDWRRSAAVELGRRVLWWRGTAALQDNDGGEQEAVGAGDGGGTSEAEIKNRPSVGPFLSRVKPPPGTKGPFVSGGGFTRD